MDCLFCKIIHNQIPAKIIYKDDFVLGFDDINPQAPHHKILIPLKHIPTTNDIETPDKEIIGHMVVSAAALAKQLGIDESGYRLVFNCNAEAGQSVFHLHLHLLGGRRLSWPPG